MANEEIARLAADTRSLLHEVLSATSGTDGRQKRAVSPWWKRHRLWVLLEAADRVAKEPAIREVDLRFAAELASTIAVLRGFISHIAWPQVSRALTSEYTHTVVMLHFASHLQAEGLLPQLVESTSQATPDLEFAVPEGRVPFFVEVYQPARLDGRISAVDPYLAKKLIAKAIGKAMKQLGKHRIGVVTIGGFNLSTESIDILERTARTHSTLPDMPSLAGLAIVSIGSAISQTPSGVSAQPLIHVRYALNHRYFAAITLKGTAEHGMGQTSAERQPLRRISQEEAKGHPVVHGSGPGVPPLFLGKGPIDFTCTSCDVILAKGVWAHSISGVVVECPKCRALSLFVAPSAAHGPTTVTCAGPFQLLWPCSRQAGDSDRWRRVA